MACTARANVTLRCIQEEYNAAWVHHRLTLGTDLRGSTGYGDIPDRHVV